MSKSESQTLCLFKMFFLNHLNFLICVYYGYDMNITEYNVGDRHITRDFFRFMY